MTRFIDKSTLALVALLAALLAGCQSGAPARKADAAGPAAAGEPADPYLRNRPEVPAAAQSAFDSALTAQRAQQWDDAERQYKQLAAKYPQFSGPLLNLALIYAQTRRPQLAEQYFKQALQVNPDNLNAYDQYGIWLRAQGRFADAEKAYQQALTRWPDHPESHLNLGILYDLYMGRLLQALEQYQRYLALTRDDKSPVRGWVVDLQRRLKSAG